MSEEQTAAKDNTEAVVDEDVKNEEIGNTLFDKTVEPKDDDPKGEDVEEDESKEDDKSSDESDEDSKEESKGDDDSEKSEEDKPEDFKLELPEDSKLSATDVEEIESYAKEQGFSKEQAGKILEMKESAYLSAQKDSEDALSDLKVQWESDSKADKEIGGDKLGESVERARRALDRFAPEAFKEMLNKTGFGNHPEVVRTFSRIGEAMSDDKTVLEGATPSQPREMKDIFYNN